MRILFVCTGNICRSPVAEHLLRETVSHGASGFTSLTVGSAGTAGMTGYPMDDRSMAFLDEHGIDGRDFVARRVSRRLLQDADLVVGLEKVHVDRCLRTAPTAMTRTFRLHQLAEWHRSGALTSLTQLPHVRHDLPRVRHDHRDPVGFSSTHAYNALLDDVAQDVAELHDLLAR
ncbi:protein tyrosine phosphatase [Corynebacterium sp.]|uniref:arsenate reductase/protein-tyrosine-phosphatase family protein n=1 Tax=Corynebacterium sp. TaxID=1720 RepID=UPI0028AE168F|nr:protein tyrosine phosphatase [Corynebacterium sp.]